MQFKLCEPYTFLNPYFTVSDDSPLLASHWPLMVTAPEHCGRRPLFFSMKVGNTTLG